MADTDDKNGETATEGDTVPETPEDTAEAVADADDSGTQDAPAEDTGPDEVGVLTEALAAVQAELDETKRQLIAVQAHNYELITSVGGDEPAADEGSTDDPAGDDEDDDTWTDDDNAESSFDAAWTVKG